MSYQSCNFNDAQKSVLEYTPKNHHLLAENYISLLKNHTDTIVYLTLKNNLSYWYFIKSCDDNQLTGFVKLNKKWVYKIIRLSNILEFC